MLLMGGISPLTSAFLTKQESFGVRDGAKIWKSADGSRLYTWDSLHGDIEVYNNKGKHLGSARAEDGVMYKSAVKGRKINV